MVLQVPADRDMPASADMNWCSVMVPAFTCGSASDELLNDSRGVGLHAGQDVLVRLDGECGVA